MATIKGKWVFKEKLTTPSWSTVTINFTTEKVVYGYSSFYGMYYSTGNFPGLAFKAKDGSEDVTTGNVWSASSNKWNVDCGYLDFGTTEQTVTDTFLTWMQANATPEAEPTPTNAVTIEYNGAVIASLKAGQSATLPCKDKPMHTDVVVSVPEGLGGSVEEWDGSYTVTDAVELISFTIDGDHYEAEDGMTWEQWCDSSYNTGGYYVSGQIIVGSGGYVRGDGLVKPADVITDSGSYDLYTGGGGVD